MTSLSSLKLPEIKDFTLERIDYYANFMLPLDLCLRNNLEIWHEYDRIAQYAMVQLRSAAVKGESTTETRSFENEYKFEVFRTWFDHLKYDIREGRVLGWLPERWRKRLTVQYQSMTKCRTDVFPVQVTRTCTHANVNFDKKPWVHLAFLYPSKGLNLGDLA